MDECSVPKKKPQSFSTLDDPVLQGLVDALARADIDGDGGGDNPKTISVTMTKGDLGLYLATRVRNCNLHLERAEQMLLINEALEEKITEQGVVDIVKEYALEILFDLDGVCAKCFFADSIYDVQHDACLKQLHIPCIPGPCAECSSLGSMYNMRHLICGRYWGTCLGGPDNAYLRPQMRFFFSK